MPYYTYGSGYGKPKLPEREGWNIDRSHMGYGICPNCGHAQEDHFWYVRPGPMGQEMEMGCKACIDGICVNRREVTGMSAINICDRCASLMTGRAIGTLSIEKAPTEYAERKEICPACVGELVAFLAEKPVRDRGTAYTEPYTDTPPKSEAMMMLEAGPCGMQTTEDGVEFMCLRAKGHKGYHIDGNKEWL
jgi:hypothetical protein